MNILFAKNYPHKILLASTSSYRKKQLESLGYDFFCAKPLVDEDQFKSGKIKVLALAEKLAKLKAHSLINSHRDHLIIGADQICHLKNSIFSKPLTRTNALEQLKKLQGKTHTLTTAVCVCFNKKSYSVIDQTHLTMRRLTEIEIKHYLSLDNPLDCAGSYKYESLGHKLFKKIDTHDPSSIIGLPLLSLQTLLLQLAKRA